MCVDLDQQLAPQYAHQDSLSTDRCEGMVTEAATCPTGFTLNTVEDQCEQTLSEDPECPTDFTFNPETNKCERR